MGTNLDTSAGTITFRDQASLKTLLKYKGVINENSQVWDVSYSLYQRIEFGSFYSRLNELRIKSIYHS